MNQNNLEFLIKAVIPALVMIVWAISQVMNREAPQPPPGRGGPWPNRPPGGLPPARMPGEGAGPREVIWQEGPPPPPRREPAAGPDEILILGTETRPVRPAPPGPPRRTRRPRPAQAGAPRPEPARPKSSSLVGDRSAATSLKSAPGTPEPSPATAAPRDAVAPRAAGFREALADPARLRDALVLGEVLGTPLALRRPVRRPAPEP